MGEGHGHNRQRQLDIAVAIIQRRHGPWALTKGGTSRAAGNALTVAHIPTGFPALDRALGIGGLPKGAICELVGPATSGKTTVALKCLVQAQARGGQVGYIDQALYFDPDYAYSCSLDLSRLVVGQPQGVREAMAMAEALTCSGGLEALVLDTPSFLWTDPEAAALLAAFLNRLPVALTRSGMAFLVLHELPLGSSPALSALAHAATLRLKVTREHWVRQLRDIRGYEARVEVLKNRVGPAGRAVTLVIDFDGTVRGNGL